MNNNAANGIMDAGERHMGNARWSSEWSFIEDADAALQKSAWPPIIEKQPVGSRANATLNSS